MSGEEIMRRNFWEGTWPPPEKQLKPDTCGTCAWFRPPNNRDWEFLPTYHAGTQGSCGNAKAALGGGISTHRDSRCKFYEPGRARTERSKP